MLILVHLKEIKGPSTSSTEKSFDNILAIPSSLTRLPSKEEQIDSWTHKGCEIDGNIQGIWQSKRNPITLLVNV